MSLLGLGAFRDLHSKAAHAMPPLSHLECEECGDRRSINKDQTADYLATGWPECCGGTMRLWTMKEVADAQA